jgi:single-stranded DNA-binding protein
MTTRTPQIHLFGNLGGDPETKTLPGRTFNRDVYDAILDDVVEKEYTTPDREILVASLAVNYKTGDGTPQTRWIRLVDHQHLLRLRRKGDRIRVDGFFRDRQYIDRKTGELKTIRELIVTAAELQILKVRDQAA